MTGYEYIEDSAGGLYLFVLVDDEVVDGIGNLEYAPLDEWENQYRELSEGNPVEVIDRWDGHIGSEDCPCDCTVAELYDELTSNMPAYGEIVCANGEIFPERMGRAASQFFGFDID